MSITKKRLILGLSSVWMLLMLYSFSQPAKKNTEPVRALYYSHLTQLIAHLDAFKKDAYTTDTALLRTHFTHCRTEYKYTEYLVTYHYPLVGQRMNGPNVPEMEPADINEVSFPTGFQVLEEYLFDESANGTPEKITTQIDHIAMYAGKLREQSATVLLTPSSVFDAIRLSLYNLAAKGISGFDATASKQSLGEAATTIMAAQEALKAAGYTSKPTDAAADRCLALLTDKKTDFDHFNRAAFLKDAYMPYLRALHALQIQEQIPFETRRSAVKTDAISFLDSNAFDPFYFAPETTTAASKALSQLGKQLFYAKALSTGGRSCGSCHNPAKAYTDGLAVNQSLQKNEGLLRNTPSLTYASLQPSLFYDTRAQYLEDQARDVLHNKAEMAANLLEAIPTIEADAPLMAAFKKAFPGVAKPVNEENIIAAITGFQRSLPSFSSAYDQYVRGNSRAMNADQVAGYNLFMGKAKCGTCHYTPLFNGTVPPFYEKTDTEIIGVPGNADMQRPTEDKDPGVYGAFPNSIKKQAYKTPTLRNIALTAPYMHNGVYKTLDEVIEFYNRGGGKGLGLNVPNQTLDDARLNLTPQEKQQLIAFLNALTDKQQQP